MYISLIDVAGAQTLRFSILASVQERSQVAGYVSDSGDAVAQGQRVTIYLINR